MGIFYVLVQKLHYLVYNAMEYGKDKIFRNKGPTASIILSRENLEAFLLSLKPDKDTHFHQDCSI